MHIFFQKTDLFPGTISSSYSGASAALRHSDTSLAKHSKRMNPQMGHMYWDLMVHFA